MKTIIILLFPLLSLSQGRYLREAVQGTIFYEITTNNIPITTKIKGKIEIFTDSLIAFDITWKIKQYGKTTLVHDKVLEASYVLEYNGQLAYLIVKNEDVLFVLHRLFDIPMIQYPHLMAYYSEFP